MEARSRSYLFAFLLFFAVIGLTAPISYAMDIVIHYESQYGRALRAEPNDPESRWWISRGRRIRGPRLPAPEANRAASQKPSSPSPRIPAPDASHAVDQQKPSTLSPANN
ncbi:hypothetical protein VitviT2T_021393 [Vitis vinifera]|uniref:Uncharacterized protein n=1 Tax=Vitis vinifera TaxID=29760 RepID=A5BU50_VITVI|nr:hypothetical protein VitviT2T_021393 [Vitis vinifera]CAN81478.1 hypothetical protein VITISV_007205 [Vitis vinifera]